MQSLPLLQIGVLICSPSKYHLWFAPSAQPKDDTATTKIKQTCLSFISGVRRGQACEPQRLVCWNLQRWFCHFIRVFKHPFKVSLRSHTHEIPSQWLCKYTFFVPSKFWSQPWVQDKRSDNDNGKRKHAQCMQLSQFHSLGRSSKDVWFDNVFRSPLKLHKAACLHLPLHHSNQLNQSPENLLPRPSSPTFTNVICIHVS